MIEFGAEQMVNALDHVADDLFGGVPDAEVFAEFGVEGFKEWLVEVRDRFFFAEDFEEGGLHAVEGFSGEVENLLKLDGIQGSGVGYLSKEFAEDGDAQVEGGDAPVEAGSGVREFSGVRRQRIQAEKIP